MSEEKVGAVGYIALILVIVFFSGVIGQTDALPEQLDILDFQAMLGNFGEVLGPDGEGTTTFRGEGGSAVRDGFLFSLWLVPTVVFALAIVEIAEHFNGLQAARKILSPLLRPLVGIPGQTGLAMIAGLQSTDAVGGMMKDLRDKGQITDREKTLMAAWSFSAGATITNALATGAVLYGLAELPAPMIVPLALMIIMKFFGANIMRLYLNKVDGKPQVERSDESGISQ
ncbi:nucleoside recognition domain-containing protein [Natranaerobius trueperi]|uniref:nucleoside recognition domain-containing protein n=1 Tax=Natranaerobius trueperi TaxID=759412 RepID=UPI001F0A98C1|nr:nucleoside recognition domain-containing protein [Natranaerobius trueperi]